MKNLLSVTPLLFTLSFTVYASGSGDHEHENNNPKQMDHKSMGHDNAHRHSQWVEPPASYASRKSAVWDDQVAVEQGRKLYATNCSSCHGDNGTGNGPVAKSLSHPPADLTNHFHKAVGKGDAYLFWRVSEGGQVEPFISMKSAMPAFKSSLSESQRWDVLAYVHQKFHKGFPMAEKQKMDSDDKSRGHSEHSEHH